MVLEWAAMQRSQLASPEVYMHKRDKYRREMQNTSLQEGGGYLDNITIKSKILQCPMQIVFTEKI